MLKRRWVFSNFQTNEKQDIHDNYYTFLYTIQKQINFFEWFEAYADYQKIDFNFSKSINV